MEDGTEGHAWAALLLRANKTRPTPTGGGGGRVRHSEIVRPALVCAMRSYSRGKASIMASMYIWDVKLVDTTVRFSELAH